jgi:WD40 repeat protein
MNGIRDLLADAATEAVPYDVTDRAVRVARRQRRLVRAAPFAAAALVLLGVGATLPLRPAPPDDGATSTAVSWLPRRLTPVTSPPPLPSGPVAPAVLAYSRSTSAPILRTEDGRSYGVPGEAVRGISPDGRWLAYSSGGTVKLRDLTGTTQRTLGKDAETQLAAWSPDGGSVAVQTRLAYDSVGADTTVVDLDTGSRLATIPAARHGEASVCGLRDATALLLCAGDPESPRFDLWLVDGVTGRHLRHDSVDPSAVLTDSERTADWASPPAGLGNSGHLLPDGRTLLVWTSDYLPDHGITMQGDLLSVDLDRPGAPARRHALPEATLGATHRNPDGSINYDSGELRSGLAAVDGGILLAHVMPGEGPGRVAEIELLDTSTGTLRPVTTVAGDVDNVVVRGQP